MDYGLDMGILSGEETDIDKIPFNSDVRASVRLMNHFYGNMKEYSEKDYKRDMEIVLGDQGEGIEAFVV